MIILTKVTRKWLHEYETTVIRLLRITCSFRNFEAKEIFTQGKKTISVFNSMANKEEMKRMLMGDTHKMHLSCKINDV